jgi:serine/threonine-protein kinase
MFTRLRNVVRFLIVFFGFTIVFILFMDKIVMPIYVRHGRVFLMPNIRLKPLSVAESMLKSHGMRWTVIDSVENPEVPPNTVVEQLPKAGLEVKKGREVKLVITQTEPFFPMPNLVGKILKAAQLDLQQYHLLLDTVKYAYSSDKPIGVVMGQSIEPGVQVALNTPVTLIISQGPPSRQLWVPDLFGLSLDEARIKLQLAGFRVGQIRYIPNIDLLPSTVIGQSPTAGTAIDNPIEINLDVSINEIKDEDS